MTESIVKKVEENPEVIQKAARRRFTAYSADNIVRSSNWGYK